MVFGNLDLISHCDCRDQLNHPTDVPGNRGCSCPGVRLSLPVPIGCLDRHVPWSCARLSDFPRLVEARTGGVLEPIEIVYREVVTSDREGEEKNRQMVSPGDVWPAI